MPRRQIICACCGHPGTHNGHGWCQTCYSRWRHAGRPKGGPPEPNKVGKNARSAEQMAEYKRLHDDGALDWEIAAQLGVSLRTIGRYRKRLGLTEPRKPSTPREDTMPYRSDANQRAGKVRPATRRAGHDFAHRRDLSADVADLTPEHLDHAVDNVDAFARDEDERETFLQMLGLADYVLDRAADEVVTEVLDEALAGAA